MGIPLRALVQLAVFLSFCVLAIVAVANAALADPPPAAAEKKTLTYYVNAALTQAYDELGLEGAAKRYFENEVLTDGLVFVTGYNTTREGTDVQVDRQKLKNYLRFSPALFSGGAGEGGRPMVCVSSRAQAGCEDCARLEAKLQTGLMIRLEKRGFNVKAGPKVSDEAELAGEAAFDFAISKSSEAQCDATVFAEVLPQEDNMEEGTEKVRANAFARFKDKMGRKLKSRAKTILALNEAPEKQGQSLLAKQAADLFAGAAAQSTGVSTQNASERVERYLRLESIPNFQTYAKFKQTVASAMPELKLEERFISPGQVQFAIAGVESMAQVATELKALGWAAAGYKLDVVDQTQNELGVALREPKTEGATR